jgi:hypothetical protein
MERSPVTLGALQVPSGGEGWPHVSLTDALD